MPRGRCRLRREVGRWVHGLRHAALVLVVALLAASLPQNASAQGSGSGSGECWMVASTTGSLQLAEPSVKGCFGSAQAAMNALFDYANTNWSIPGNGYPVFWLDSFGPQVLAAPFDCQVRPLPVVHGSGMSCGYTWTVHEIYWSGESSFKSDGRLSVTQINPIVTPTPPPPPPPLPGAGGAPGPGGAGSGASGDGNGGAGGDGNGPGSGAGNGSDGGGGGDGGGNGGGDDGNGQSCPADAPAAPPPSDAGELGNPIRLSTQSKIARATDYLDAGRHPLSLVRHYDSARATGRFPVSAAGLGDAWQHNYALGLREQGGTVWVDTEGGGAVTFSRQQDGRYTPVNTADSLTRTEGSPVTWQWRRAADDAVWHYSGPRLVRVVERNGWVMRFDYDAAGRLARVTNHFGRSLQFSHDAAGRLLSVLLPDGTPVQYGHDGRGQLQRVTLADGASRQYLYEDARNAALLTGLVNEYGTRVATYGYDAQGRAISSEHAGRGRYSIDYGTPTTGPDGSSSSELRVSTPLGTTLALRQIVSPQGVPGIAQASEPLMAAVRSDPVTQGGGDAASRQYNADGSVARETDRLGIPVEWTWDPARRLPLSLTRAGGRPEAQTTRTDWHPNLRLPLRITRERLRIEYEWDAGGNKIAQTATDLGTTHAGTTNAGTSGGASTSSRTERWTYDARGLPTSWTDAAGERWAYTYDEQGNRTQVRDPAGRITTSTWDAAGRLVSRTDPAGVTTRWLRDARGRVVRIERSGGAGAGRPAEVTALAYTPDSRLAALTLPNGYELRMAYDSARRLVALQDNRGARLDYTLDAAGNRVREELRNEAGQLVAATSRSLDTLGQVDAVQSATGAASRFSRDANGSLIGQTDPLGQLTRSVLDPLGRLQATAFADGEQALYLHNAQGQRVFTSEPQAEQHSPDRREPGQGFIDWLRSRLAQLFQGSRARTMLGTAHTYGDGPLPTWTLLGDYDNGTATGNGTTEYVWLPTDGGGAIPIGMVRNGRAYAIHTDQLGSPRLMTDEQASPVWQWAYSGFGEVEPAGLLQRQAVVTTGRSNSGRTVTALKATAPQQRLDLRFPGQVRDAVVGVNHNFLREYGKDGRYTQADSIGMRGGWNRFGYAGANALNSTDPTGQFVLAIPLVPLVVTGTDVLIGAGLGVLGYGLDRMFAKPPANAYDPNGPKAPGKPGEAEEFKDPKGGENWTRNPNGRGYGWQAADGGVWCPTGPNSGSTGDAHGGPHWDVQYPGGRYDNVYPGGRRR